MQFSNVNVENNPSSNSIVNILHYSSLFEEDINKVFDNSEFFLKRADSISELKHYTHIISTSDVFSVIIIEVENSMFQEAHDFILSLKNNFFTKAFTTIFLLTEPNKLYVRKAMEIGVSDCYFAPIPFEDLKERVKFLNFYKSLRSQVSQLSQVPQAAYQMPLSKRLLDLTVACASIIILFPLLVVVAILVKLDSPGPVFYNSKRVGTGYKIFDFYKFRSMRMGADAEIASLADQNQYGNAAFFKFENDPRVTKLGTFLRNSSIDELPQLLNVIKGDMSLVGNRPLPLYEAEQLTTNEWAMRFLGPAGLTGLWQISKRGKKDMSERERKLLDNYYAKNYSLWLDIKIILKTLPALIQKEKV
ncbi:sugar transferase [Pedobacter sp. SD-b]|uniref:Sugar transferase n=1 Tax=Pedobacter segetis TaxID=2793069 RepID=A0ABS1BM83_9SPHI|nr:sugar transferase [Pedobacter segetis]MBK0384007.1 sugar transferase [Pedobacter segetis]